MAHASEPRASRRLTNRLVTLVIYMLAASLFLGLASLRLSRATRDESWAWNEVTILHPAIGFTLWWSSVAVAVILMLASAYSIRRTLLRYPFIGLLLAIVMYPCCSFYFALKNAGSWTVHDCLTAEDGKRYAFLNTSFLQAQMMVIAREGPSRGCRTTYRVLVQNNGDSPRSWASLVRPANCTDRYGQLYLSPDGVLVGVRHHNHSFLAYDVNRKLAMGHGEIERISPFLLLDDEMPIHDADVDRTIEQIKERASFCESVDDVRFAVKFVNGEPYPDLWRR